MSGSDLRQALWLARAMARADLSPFGQDEIERLASISDLRQVADGERLARAGASVEKVFVVRSGEVHLTTSLPREGRHVVAVIRPPGVLGDIPLFCGRAMPFDAFSRGAGAVIEIGAADLLDLLRESPRLSLRWTISVGKRMEETQRRMVLLLTRRLPEQIAAMLLSERGPSADPPTVPLTHELLAQLLGVRRQSVTRVLKEFEDAGLVRRSYAAVLIEDLSGLAEIAGVDLADPEYGTLETLDGGEATSQLR